MSYIPLPDYRMGWIAVAFGLSWMFALIMIDLSKRREARLATPAYVEPEIEEDDVEQLSLLDAVEQRDKVLEKVAADNSGWMAEALSIMERIEPGTEDIGEGFRERLINAGLRPPRHPGVWGAYFNTLIRRKVLIPTGEMRPMRAKGSNARKSQVLIKAGAA
jgi:hypothetical protein